MELVHLLHCLGRCHLKTGAMQAHFDEPQIAKGHYAGKDVAPGLAVGPVPNREKAHQIIVLALAESVLHDVPVQAGLEDYVRAPVVVVGDDDVLAEAVDMPADAVEVLPKA
ncbi:MAG: hypothetical protein ACOC0U_04730, partial [Desulfovibrionales bacterium]